VKPLIFCLSANNTMGELLLKTNNYEYGEIEIRDFPDEEKYIRFKQSIKNRDIILLNSLEYPNNKLLTLLLTAETAKTNGARTIGLCAPYLAYMRQDKIFNKGEGITSKYFAKLLSNHFDWLVTVDPHLHRFHQLNEIYSIPNIALHSTDNIARWILNNINDPLIIGPDSESKQWAQELANTTNAPYIVLKKIRHDEHKVEISIPKLSNYLTYTPVIIDDIISTGRTMIETVIQIKKFKIKAPVCIGIHGIFVGNSYDSLLKAGAKEIVTCNTINHKSNKINVANILDSGIQKQLNH